MTTPGTRLLVATTIPETAWTIMRGQLRFLREAGFAVTLVTAPGPRLADTGRREGVPVRAVAMDRELSPRSDWLALLRLVRLVRQLRPQVSYVGTPKAGLLVGLATMLARTPRRVYLLRGLRLETEGGWRRAILWLAEWVSIRCAHEVLVVSPSLLSRARQLRLLNRSAGVVAGRGASNGVDLQAFAPAPQLIAAGAQVRAELGIPPRAYVFGFVGRLTIDKGVLELIEAFSQVQAERPDSWLLVAGAPELRGLPEPTRHALDRLPHVRFTGWREDTAAIYQAIDCLVLPTHREGFPNVPLEAGAAGKPVITTTATGAVDSILDGETGLLVPVGSPTGLAAAMFRLAGDPALGLAMGQAGRNFVTEFYSNRTVWKELLEFLDGGGSDQP